MDCELICVKTVKKKREKGTFLGHSAFSHCVFVVIWLYSFLRECVCFLLVRVWLLVCPCSGLPGCECVCVSGFVCLCMCTFHKLKVFLWVTEFANDFSTRFVAKTSPHTQHNQSTHNTSPLHNSSAIHHPHSDRTNQTHSEKHGQNNSRVGTHKNIPGQRFVCFDFGDGLHSVWFWKS